MKKPNHSNLVNFKINYYAKKQQGIQQIQDFPGKQEYAIHGIQFIR
jgi:hypothetical protein